MTKVNQFESSGAPARGEDDSLRWDGHMADDVGATFGVEPLASLTATRDEIVVSGTRGTYHIPRRAVTKIGRGKMYPWFFAGIRIHHTMEAVPRELQFKPLDSHWREVRRRLGELGYPCA